MSTAFIAFYSLFKNTFQEKLASYIGTSQLNCPVNQLNCCYMMQGFTEENFRLVYSLKFILGNQSRLWKQLSATFPFVGFIISV